MDARGDLTETAFSPQAVKPRRSGLEQNVVRSQGLLYAKMPAAKP